MPLLTVATAPVPRDLEVLQGQPLRLRLSDLRTPDGAAIPHLGGAILRFRVAPTLEAAAVVEKTAATLLGNPDTTNVAELDVLSPSESAALDPARWHYWYSLALTSADGVPLAAYAGKLFVAPGLAAPASSAGAALITGAGDAIVTGDDNPVAVG